MLSASVCRVSLFLAEGIQLQSGKLVIASCINNKVGLVRSFGADGTLESEEKLHLASQQVSGCKRCPCQALMRPVYCGVTLLRLAAAAKPVCNASEQLHGTVCACVCR